MDRPGVQQNKHIQPWCSLGAENWDYDPEFAASSICIDDFVIVVCHLGCEKLPSYKLALNKTIAVFMRY